MISLPEEQYFLAAKVLRTVSINHLFARSVVEQRVIGRILVDNLNNPKIYYFVHPYGMALLLGDSEDKSVRALFKKYVQNRRFLRPEFEWVQAYPESWHTWLGSLGFETFTRVNFSFNRKTFDSIRREELPRGEFEVARTNAADFKSIKGRVIPQFFWKNAEQFEKEGVGFSVILEGQAVSTAYAAYIHDQMLEIGIETSESQRRKGLAILSCSALIEYCLSREYEPVWSCLRENTGSYDLARKLGFEPTFQFPIYKVSAEYL